MTYLRFKDFVFNHEHGRVNCKIRFKEHSHDPSLCNTSTIG